MTRLGYFVTRLGYFVTRLEYFVTRFGHFVAKGHRSCIKRMNCQYPRLLTVLGQLCFGSRRANLGMPGDLVIQERLVALK